MYIFSGIVYIFLAISFFVMGVISNLLYQQDTISIIEIVVIFFIFLMILAGYYGKPFLKRYGLFNAQEN